MSELENFLKSSLLETLLETRGDEFEMLCIKRFKSCNRNFEDDPEQELLDELEQSVKDENTLKNIRRKINKFENYLFNDYETSIKRLYKLGFIDGYSFKREIKDVIDEESRKQIGGDFNE